MDEIISNCLRPYTLSQASKLVVSSEAAIQQICADTGLAPDKVDTVTKGECESSHRNSQPRRISETRFGITELVICVSGFQPWYLP